ncbi:MAG TPA: aminotransferase class V-fold PLP-dependent enzyme [Longimicrobiales bacterium]|nr:aminotransferase class V-fold PLP-dependent enzyme [Longimicrobiales bacterium]
MIHYLDHAATSALRPPEVSAAVAGYLERCGATPGRGGHRLALDAGRIVLEARRAVARVLGLGGDPGRLTFAANATQGINTALWGLLEPGDVLVVTAMDHNAVLRPAHRLAGDRGVEVRLVPARPDGSLDMDVFRRALRGARLVALNAVSNVLGTRLPVEELAPMAHAAGALVLVDTAQSAGHVPMDLAGADLVAFTGHKGLLGPQGTGGLWVRDGVQLRPLIQGGTGGNSLEREMPAEYPDHLEAGTLNGPGIAGLLAGCRVVLEEGVDAIHHREARLKARLLDGLRDLPGVRIVSPPAPDGAGIVTLTARSADPAQLAHRLDRDHGVLARAGLHCAPEAHRLAGTAETGALRLSVGWGSTGDDVEGAVAAMAAVLESSPVRTP